MWNRRMQLYMVDNNLVGYGYGVSARRGEFFETKRIPKDKFYVDDMEIMNVRYMPLDYAGLGFYTFGKQKLIIDDIEFIQM